MALIGTHSKTAGRAVQGLTFIEVILVIALFGFVFSVVAPFTGQSTGQRKVAAASELVIDALRQAQFSAMHGRSPQRFGVRLEAGQFVLFSGATYSPSDPDNEVHQLDSDVGLAWSLDGGVQEILFDNHRGLPSVTGTVTITSSGFSRTVTVGAEGAIGEEL
jgi:type II secretory pathway pseudopilin PulG